MRLCASRLAAVLLIGGLSSTLGCSGGEEVDLLPVHPVSGTLTYKDEPMSRAVIIFYPETKNVLGGDVHPRATADEQGKYALTSIKTGDGAPAGKYKVTIYWPEPGPKDADELPPDRLKGAYSKQDKPKLDAEVTTGENTINYKLP